MNSGRDPLAYFLTWTTYGTWLHGDERGSFDRKKYREKLPDAGRRDRAEAAMAETAITLDDAMRALCTKTIGRVAALRRWQVFAINVRTNHVHLVVAARQPPRRVMADLKAWCTRDLRGQIDAARRNWWTERGSYRQLFDEDSLAAAIRYVNECQ